MKTSQHIVPASPWPVVSAFLAMSLVFSVAYWFFFSYSLMILMSLSALSISSFCWWRDVVREAALEGHHTSLVVSSLSGGMVLFILSEVCFFCSFFWAYGNFSLSSDPLTGNSWPPLALSFLDPMGVPLLNTVILLSSGATVTMAHHFVIEGNKKMFLVAMVLTLFLGVEFTSLQIFEYSMSEFTISDSSFGTVFFVTTGFHGLHVFIGSVFLFICLLRGIWLNFSSSHHFGFLAAIWYWHFVDVVWLFLFSVFYLWASF